MKYIRIDVDTTPSDLVKFLYHVDGWHLKEPNLIISVIGSTQRCQIQNNVYKAFKKGLVKAAGSTGAWIITYGTSTGVNKLVSEAVSNEEKKKNLVLLGIAQWGKTAFREKLIVS